jgi:hypothetical protein
VAQEADSLSESTDATRLQFEHSGLNLNFVDEYGPLITYGHEGGEVCWEDFVIVPNYEPEEVNEVVVDQIEEGLAILVKVQNPYHETMSQKTFTYAFIIGCDGELESVAVKGAFPYLKDYYLLVDLYKTGAFIIDTDDLFLIDTLDDEEEEIYDLGLEKETDPRLLFINNAINYTNEEDLKVEATAEANSLVYTEIEMGQVLTANNIYPFSKEGMSRLYSLVNTEKLFSNEGMMRSLKVPYITYLTEHDYHGVLKDNPSYLFDYAENFGIDLTSAPNSDDDVANDFQIHPDFIPVFKKVGFAGLNLLQKFSKEYIPEFAEEIIHIIPTQYQNQNLAGSNSIEPHTAKFAVDHGFSLKSFSKLPDQIDDDWQLDDQKILAVLNGMNK